MTGLRHTQRCDGGPVLAGRSRSRSVLSAIGGTRPGDDGRECLQSGESISHEPRPPMKLGEGANDNCEAAQSHHRLFVVPPNE